ncbi:MAG: carboxypeptidase regulatory-like domain-containing protein [Planctomycetes bacterium]|nr:carboxypeptidase regulatory-like domain-containing protein [Planctomycetota bacterium]
MPRWLAWSRDRANRRQSCAENGAKPQTETRGFDFWRLVKRLFLLLVTGLLLLAVGMLIVSVVVPWLHRIRFVATHEFGPAVERRFHEPTTRSPDIVFWDLDRDVIMTPSFDVVMPSGKQLFQWLSDDALQNETQLRHWIQDCGIDLALSFVEKDPNNWSWYIMGLGADRLNCRFEERSFDGFKPKHLIERETIALRVVGNRVRPGRQSALCIKTDQGKAGVLEYDGLFDGVTDGFKIRYKLLERREKGEKAPGQPARVPVSDSNHPEVLHDPNSLQGQTRGYLPTQEIWLQAGPELKDCFVDLDSGRVLSAPTELVDSLRRAGQLNEGRVQIDVIQDWLRKNSVDLFWRRSRSGLALVDGVSILAEPTHQRHRSVWATESADNAVIFSEHISNVLAQGMSQSDVAQMQLIQVGGTNIIRTRSGRAGLVQIREMDMQSGRIRIRYKLVEGWAKSEEEIGQPKPVTVSDSEALVDFNDANFWQTQIVRHLEGVRTLDCELMTNRLVYGTDANTPESKTRRQYRLKWDRDHRWIDCAVASGEQNLLGNRVIQGDQYGWSRHSKDWTKHKAGAGGMAMSQFSHFGRMRNHPYEHAFSVAKGILCSDTMQMTQAQGVIDWSQIELAHSLDDQGRHVLRHAVPTPGPDGQMVTAELVLVGSWEQGAFKFEELRGQCQEMDMDSLLEAFSDHVFVDGLWVPQRAELYEWTDPSQKGPQTLQEKTIVTTQRMMVNQPMTAAMFDGFEPPVGVRVDDQITGTHYRVWPDLAQIKASGGKDRVSVSGRVYLDGKPSVGTTVNTRVHDDPNEHVAHTVNATSDDKGEFVLEGLVPGLEYMIQTKDQAGHNVSQPVQLSELGEDHTGLKLDMTSGLTVTGTVTDPNGQPLAEARVKFSGKSVVKTDEQGRYTVHGLYADKGYQVEAVAWGHAPLDPDGEASRGNFKMVLGDEGELEPFDIVLQKEKILSGRVVDQDGKPVSGVRVMVWGSPFGIGDLWQWYDTRTDQDGAFSVGNLGERIYGFLWEDMAMRTTALWSRPSCYR